MSALTPKEKIAKATTEEGLKNGLTHDQIRKKKAEVAAHLDAEKDRTAEISDKIDNTDRQFAQELENSVNLAELQALKKGKPVSKETQNVIKIAAQKARNAHTRERTVIDLKGKRAASGNVESRITEEGINACLGFYDERICFYDGLLNSLATMGTQTTSAPQKQRRNSIDMRVPTFISGLEDAANEAGGQFMRDARATREHGFKSAWVRGKVPEYLGKTTASVLVDDVLPIVGKGIQKADEWTGGTISTVLGAMDSGTWGTGVRRGLRDGLGASQRLAQNAGDGVQYLGEVGLLLCSFGGNTTVKSAQIATKASETASAVNKAKRLALFEKTVAENVRPHWTHSEKFVGEHLGKAARPQVSFLHGEEVSRGVRDSVRPDFIIDKTKTSIEVKNYNISTGKNDMIGKIVAQAKKREIHLPEGTTQRVKIDIRGQEVSTEMRDTIKTKIETKSGGIIKAKDVEFFY